jgi:predicted N-formylglutamate amidohydrolase
MLNIHAIHQIEMGGRVLVGLTARKEDDPRQVVWDVVSQAIHSQLSRLFSTTLVRAGLSR